MNPKAIFKYLKWSTAALLLLSLGSPTAVMAGVNSIASYSILAETARPIDSTIQYDNYWGYLFTTANSTVHPGLAPYVVPIHLPEGTQIVGVTVQGIDKDANANFDARVWRYNLYDSSVYLALTELASSSGAMPDASGRVEITVGLNHLNTPDKSVVNNADYSYAVYIDLPKSNAQGNAADKPALAVFRIVVKYQYVNTLALPAVTK